MSFLDYDLLAAALLRAGSRSDAAAGADSGTNLLAGSLIRPTAGGGRGSVGLENGVDAAVVEDEAGSWADAVEAEQPGLGAGEETTSDVGSYSDDSVVMPVGSPVVGEKVKRTVKFGGLGDFFPVSEVAQPEKPGYFSSVVRRGQAVTLQEKLAVLCGVKVPKQARESLAICTFSAGVMPDAVRDGKRRLRSLASVGDAALTMHLVTHQWSVGATVESAQSMRSRLTSNKYLNTVMVQSGLVECVSYAGGVDPVTSVATATAFEAVLGVLVLFRSADVVRQFLLNVGLLQ